MQTRITSFFSPGPANPPRGDRPRVSFMDLPQSVRRRIYQELHLISSGSWSWKPITLNTACLLDKKCLFQTSESDQDQQFVKDPDAWPRNSRTSRYIKSDERFIDCRGCRCNNWSHWTETTHQCRAKSIHILPDFHMGCYCELDRIPTALFLVCRAWSKDAISTFYSENHFRIYYQGDGGLSVLDTLRPTTLQAMTRLTVHLSISFCDDGHDCLDPTHCWKCHPSCKVIGHDSALCSHTKDTGKILRDWTRLCQRLAAAIQPGILKLTLIANTRNVGVASALMEPLQSLPRLRGCSISLSKYYDADLQNLAEATCLTTMGYPESRIQDPFPFDKLPNEVQLEILRHTGLKAPSHLGFERHKPGSKDYTDHFVSPQCIYMPDILEEDGCVMCCTDKQQHSAANPACSCWNLSIATMMVNHKMRQMSQSILYGENTWVMDLAYYFQLCNQPHLQSLLKYARNIQVRVSTKEVGVPYYEAGQRWCNFVRALKRDSLHPLQLTLTLTMLHPSHSPDDATSISDTIFEGDEWMGHRIFTQRAKNIFLVSGWRPKNLFVRISRRHYTWSDGSRWWGEAIEGRLALCEQWNFRTQEREIERTIMNDDTYQSDARGKRRMIHEPISDLLCNLPDYEPDPEDHVEAEDMIHCSVISPTWDPLSGEWPCYLCGPSNGTSCYKRLP